MKYSIKRATPPDGAGMLAVHVDAIDAIADRFYSPEIKASWAHGLTADGYGRSMAEGEDFEVAVDGSSRVIAFCGVRNGEVFGLYVHPEAQGAGIGRTLLTRGEATALRQRPNSRSLPLRASLNAKAFYERHGYRVVAIKERPTRGGLTMLALEMSKPLAG